MPKKVKKVPLRKCIITNDMKPKQSLIRIVRTKEGDVFVDPSGKKNGRGAYVSIDQKVVEQAKKSQAIERHFQVSHIEHVYQDLLKVINGESIE
ncbi:YlxR family protein [Amphibacillus sp. MSJ-3]|uniref:RNase P modulator RnpM n=1 Tax=Amphibacillus sp. MSJ-3 TaxID=2841505 RepID=UPI001C0F325C|nr:YlxR family protein [Amphibacillus sp. MSJ-3]MBU5595600.1 YlxR family protein [Amphibacillus sp. MSJ-3]